MAKAKSNLQDFESFETLPYHETFCPFESSANIPVPCDRVCACFTVQKEYGRVVFAGCSLKWLAKCHNRGILPVLP